MANISKFKQTLKDIRVKSVKELISIMKRHDRKEVETVEFDDTPIVIEKHMGTHIYVYTLDAIRVVDDTEPYLIFSCSSSYDDEDVTPNDITISNLVEILNWVQLNEEWLFENEDE